MKKVISVLLSACMICASLPVLAAEQDSEAMQAALADVKAKVTVPEELELFTSSVSSEKESGSYRFVWEDKDGDKRLSVTAGKDEKIMNYRLWEKSANYDTAQFNALSVDAAKASVDAFLAQIIPEKTEKLRYIRGVNQGASMYSYEYQHEENGYPVLDEGVTVSVHIKDGNAVVTGMSIDRWTTDGFTVPEKDIGIDEAKELYKKNGGYELQYQHNYRDDSLYLVYQARDGVKYFDAVTGEEVKYHPYQLYRNSYSSMKASVSGGAADAAAEATFTPEESAELERIEGMLPAEQVVEKLRAIPEIEVPEGSVLSQSISKRYYQDKENTQYVLSLRIGTDEDAANASVDAMTGELLSYHHYDYKAYPVTAEENKEEKVDTKKQSDVIDRFVQTYAPTYYAQVRAVADDEDYSAANHSFSKSYVRLIDDVPYYSDGISASYDMEKEKITSFWVDFSWIEKKTNVSDVKFDLNSAYDKVFENAGIVETYIVNEKGEPTLVYTLEKSEYATIDAVSGKAVGWNGREVSEPITSYTDIDGHWAQKYIASLAEVGYTAGSSEFRPDDGMTQKDFLTLIASGYDGAVEDLYDDMISQKVLSKNEKAPDSVITKEQALTYMLNWQGYREVANLKGIFVTGFIDESECQNIGYVAIAKGLGIVTGDTDNKFYPNKKLTRAEAAAMLYKSLDK